MGVVSRASRLRSHQRTAPPVPDAALFAPVRSQTAFEETLERLGTAIKLGLLEPGTQLPAERELCARLGISRSTLRQALTALVQSGHLRAVRGRGGGTFVAECPPRTDAPPPGVLARWRDACDGRFAIEVGVAALAADRADAEVVAGLEAHVATMDACLEDFEAYRQADVRLHVGLAEATGSARLITGVTESQGEMTDVISHIAHPPEVLARSNEQHHRLVEAVAHGEGQKAAWIMVEHLRGTELVLGGLLPRD